MIDGYEMVQRQKAMAESWNRLGSNLKKHELTLENTFQVFTIIALTLIFCVK